MRQFYLNSIDLIYYCFAFGTNKATGNYRQLCVQTLVSMKCESCGFGHFICKLKGWLALVAKILSK